MGSHQDHNDHSNEKKPVAFTVPLIFGSVIVFIIVLLVSLGDPKKDCCCNEGKCSTECVEACEKDGHPAMEHGNAHGTEAEMHGHEGTEAHHEGTEAHHEAASDASAEHNEEAHH